MNNSAGVFQVDSLLATSCAAPARGAHRGHRPDRRRAREAAADGSTDLARRRGRAPHLERQLQLLLERAGFVPLDERQQLGSSRGDRSRRAAARPRQPDVRRHGEIVEPTTDTVAGDVRPGVARRLEHAERLVSKAAKIAVGGSGEREQLAGQPVRHAAAVRPVRSSSAPHRNTGRVERAAIAVAAQPARHEPVARIALVADGRDALVAQLEQVPRRQLSAMRLRR